MQQGSSNKAMAFIFATLLIDIIGIGIIIPVMPKLIENLIHGDLSVASKYNGWLIFTYAIMQFICSPILGGLSDKYGRRPILLISLFGLGLDYVLLALAPNITWLFIGRAIAGIGGASFTTASAYIADVSTPEKRGQNFGLIGVAFGLGFIIGPVIGGLSSHHFGPRAAFWIASVLSLINFLFGLFVLPESLPTKHRRKFEWKRANPIGSLVSLKRFPVIASLIVTLLLVNLAAHAVQSTWTYFTMFQFKWSEQMVGYSLGVVGLLIAFVQGFLIRLVIPKFGQANTVFYGLIFYFIGLLLFAFATQEWMMFAILVIYCLGGIAGPALQGIISTQVPQNEQGELQGGLTSLMSITSILGPLMMNNLFAYFSTSQAPVFFPGAPFLAGAVLLLVGILLAIPFLKKHRTPKSS
jgi:DHA1 family tetracycline resistance protein-like MFS transporter